jgi:DNA-binding Xre family transcriptional regulator
MATGKKAATTALSNEIAAILRAQIARKKIVQSALSTAVNLSQAQLSGILNANKHVDVEKLDELCWALGLELRLVVAEADENTSARQSSPEWTAKTVVRD